MFCMQSITIENIQEMTQNNFLVSAKLIIKNNKFYYNLQIKNTLLINYVQPELMNLYLNR